MGKRKRKSWKLKLDMTALERLAPQILDYAELGAPPEGGFSLSGSSGIWQKANGTLTAHLVYRSVRPDGCTTKSYTVRGLRLDRTREAGHG